MFEQRAPGLRALLEPRLYLQNFVFINSGSIRARFTVFYPAQQKNCFAGTGRVPIPLKRVILRAVCKGSRLWKFICSPLPPLQSRVIEVERIPYGQKVWIHKEE